MGEPAPWPAPRVVNGSAPHRAPFLALAGVSWPMVGRPPRAPGGQRSLGTQRRQARGAVGEAWRAMQARYLAAWPKIQAKSSGTSSVCNGPRFTDNLDGSVTDNLTGPHTSRCVRRRGQLDGVYTQDRSLFSLEGDIALSDHRSSCQLNGHFVPPPGVPSRGSTGSHPVAPFLGSVLEGTYTCMLFHRPHRAIQQQGSFTYMLVDGGVCALSFLPSW